MESNVSLQTAKMAHGRGPYRHPLRSPLTVVPFGIYSYIIGYWMDSGSSDGRAAAAFAAIGLIIVTLGINISANSISAANDLMAFCPKYINIRRGQLLAAFIGSWVRLNSAEAKM